VDPASIPGKRRLWKTWPAEPVRQRRITRAFFSQERMTYLPEESKIVYRSKDNRQEKVFEALDWLAALSSHFPNQGEQMVRYYGFYSNVSRGLRQKENVDGLIPCIIEPEENAKPNRNWARLINNDSAFCCAFQSISDGIRNYCAPTLVGVQRKLGVRRQFFKGYQDVLPEILSLTFCLTYQISKAIGCRTFPIYWSHFKELPLCILYSQKHV